MNRRSFITSAIGLIATPAIVRASSLMPVKSLPVCGMFRIYMNGKLIMVIPAENVIIGGKELIRPCSEAWPASPGLLV